MRRRKFFGLAMLAGVGLSARGASAESFPKSADATGKDAEAIDPYFLDNGEVSPREQESIEAFIDYQERAADGRPAVLPRGGKPKRAPTFRFLHLDGELGDPDARLVGALSIKPVLEASRPLQLNAQILGFNCSTRDWSRKKGHGTLTVEIRARLYGEPMTWLYIEQFDVRKGGGTSVGLGYVAQRDGLPEPVICEEPRVDLRIQLMRHRKAPGVLRKILSVGSFLIGAPLTPGGSPPNFGQSRPTLRVPRMLHEGVALAQATVGGMADEAPIWRSGFTSFALAPGSGRMALRPGLWVAIDDSPDIDYRSIRLEDMGGRIGLTQEGKPINQNYLVLSVELEQAEAGGVS